MTEGEWVWSSSHRQTGQIVERVELWGEVTLRIWLPQSDSVVRVRESDVETVAVQPPVNESRLRFVLAASRIAHLLAEDVLLAPIDSTVIPLPHQLRALRKAVSRDRIRVLLADEVGLGKTIEAGLIIRELKLRGLARRILVVAPKGLITQWIAEMDLHFGEDFRFFSPSDFEAYRRIARAENVWSTSDQVICSLDSIKPMENRKGWSCKRIGEYNRDRIHDLTAAGWDLIIVDEAHRLGGSSEKVARHQLGRALSDSSPFLLLLSATPHQGKTDAFYRLVSLLDEKAFPDESTVTRERVAPFVVRTEKKFAFGAEGEPLFKPRRTQLLPVSWDGHGAQQELYDSVTEYAREGYNRARAEKKNAVGFLMILMQRLVTSSTQAIIGTLERRLEVLEDPESAQQLLFDFEEWAEMDGEEQVAQAIRTRSEGLKQEVEEVNAMLQAAKRVAASGPDAKAEAFLNQVYTLQQEGADPELKILVFTEFVPTQTMLAEFLTSRGISVVCLNGSMSMEERRIVQRKFSEKTRVLISTDAGGEGLNLQFCHVVINYDLPWNPMRLEQRIGRVDRIGQKHVVRAINFVLEDSVEYRVQEVLQEKLDVIFEEFGVDKTGDVLDNAEAGQIFEELYVESMIHPDGALEETEKIVQLIRDRAEAGVEGNRILTSDTEDVSAELARIRSLPLAKWIRQMVTNYLEDRGGAYIAERNGIKIRWPEAEDYEPQTYRLPDSQSDLGGETSLTLNHPRVRGMIDRLPAWLPHDSIPTLCVKGLTAEVSGVWSLWRVQIRGESTNRAAYFPVFIHEDGRVLSPTAQHLWKALTDQKWEILEAESANKETTESLMPRITEVAREEGETVYDQLKREHLEGIEREREKLRFHFNARRTLIERVGLPEVRTYRLTLLEQENEQSNRELDAGTSISPSLDPLTVVQIAGG